MMKLKVKLNKQQLKDMVKDNAWYLKENEGLVKLTKSLNKSVSKLQVEKADLLISNQDWAYRYRIQQETLEAIIESKDTAIDRLQQGSIAKTVKIDGLEEVNRDLGAEICKLEAKLDEGFQDRLRQNTNYRELDKDNLKLEDENRDLKQKLKKAERMHISAMETEAERRHIYKDAYDDLKLKIKNADKDNYLNLNDLNM